jgi:predicted DNA-binding protein
MAKLDYTQSTPKRRVSVQETPQTFQGERKKFATQMDARLLERLREYSKSEGRQIQSVLEEAVKMLLKEKQGYTMRPDVKAAMEASFEEFDDLYKRLAQ